VWPSVRGRLLGGVEAALDGGQAVVDAAELVAERAQLLLAGREAVLDDRADAAPAAVDVALGALDEIVDSVRDTAGCALGTVAGLDGRPQRAVDCVAEGVLEFASLWHGAEHSRGRGCRRPGAARMVSRAVTDPAPLHIHPAAPLADRVLLPGDPHRALAVAQHLLDEPLMFNHHRGLWGYTGAGPDGEPLTVQATGMGGPSAAIVIEELVQLGARILVRIGTCGALRDDFDLGDLVAADEVIGADGTSAALGAPPRQRPDRVMREALVTAGARPAGVVTTDLFYDPRGEVMADWLASGADVVEMEAAALLAVAARHGVRAAVVLAITDLLADGGRARMEREAIGDLASRLGEVGWAAIAAGSST